MVEPSRSILMRSKCLADGCPKLEELANGRSAGGFCAGHRKRKVRQQTISGDLRERSDTPFDGMAKAAIALADAAAELGNEEWHLARERFRKAKRRAFRAYLERLTGLDGPRVIRTEKMPDGTTRITFQKAK